MDWWRSFTKVWTSTRGRLHRGMDRWRSFTKVRTGGGAHHRAPDLVVETREVCFLSLLTVGKVFLENHGCHVLVLLRSIGLYSPNVTGSGLCYTILASWSGGGHGATATGQLSGSTVVRIFIS
ncbi:unnamed protein product [Sphagnum compactum]